MHVSITRKDEGGGWNCSGSSIYLVNYLEKENYLDEERTQLKPESEREFFFSETEDRVTPSEVTSKIDSNKRNLLKKDDKYFLVNISPSQDELRHIGSDPKKLKEYTKAVMGEYAKNFNKGLESKDLVWYAKLEREREYKHTDQEVKLGEKKVGEKKPGNNMHVQVIVSRKCAKNERKLSVRNNSREENPNRPIKGNTGFDRVQFSLKSIKQFDEMYQYPRQVNELERQQVMKHGTAEEKLKYQENQIQKNKKLAQAKAQAKKNQIQSQKPKRKLRPRM